jgi:hypothetical protein
MQVCLKENINGSTLLFLLFFVQRDWYNYAEPLSYFHILHAYFNLL